MLQFNPSWRFDSPGSIPSGVTDAFFEIIAKVARGEQAIFEHFKTYFAIAAGSTSSSWSSNASWAESDLLSQMDNASKNAPLYIEAFYDACETLRKKNSLYVPEVNYLNKILSNHNADFQIDGNKLIATNAVFVSQAPSVPVSLDERAREIIQASLSEGQKLLTEGRYRQAVQEVLWLLETISTAFQDLGSEEKNIGGKYFNKIIDKLRLNHEGTTLEQVIEWIKKLHGYLSAPTGGGIRHGMHLKEGVVTSASEGRLYYNLVMSYITFLLSEYERLKNSL